ncbi:hypothetical protein LINPERHAP1_LOCUS19645 [Linum perenne]
MKPKPLSLSRGCVLLATTSSITIETSSANTSTISSSFRDPDPVVAANMS